MKLYRVIKQHYDIKPNTVLMYENESTAEPDSLLLRELSEPIDQAPLYVVPKSKLEMYRGA